MNNGLGAFHFHLRRSAAPHNTARSEAVLRVEKICLSIDSNPAITFTLDFDLHVTCRSRGKRRELRQLIGDFPRSR